MEGEIPSVKSQIEKRLAQLGLKLKDLAALTDDDYRNVQRWVREDTAPPIPFLARFCAKTDTSADWLLLGRGDPVPLSPTEAEEQLRQIRAIVLGEAIAAAKSELAQIVAAELIKKDRLEGQEPDAPPSTEKRRLPRRRRGG